MENGKRRLPNSRSLTEARNFIFEIAGLSVVK